MKTKPPTLSDKEQVTQHISKLEPVLGKTIEYIRRAILSTDKEIGERIKWNNPSFYYTGEMKPFDPKEYKREIIVMNLFKGRMMLVFPSGAKVNEAVRTARADPETQKRLAAAYIEPMALSPGETATALAAEHERLGKLIQQLGIRADGTG